MRIRTLKAQLAKGRRFTAWLGPIRVTLSKPGALDAWGKYDDQRRIASTAIDVSCPHPAIKKERKWNWEPNDNGEESSNGTNG